MTTAAVDLADDHVFADARRRRARHEYADEVADAIELLNGRVKWCLRKASRLPQGNGRRAALTEIARAQALINDLTRALGGKPGVKVPPDAARSARERRAILLLNQLVAIG